MSLARALRIFLALALLSAQQVALSHEVWHLGKHGSQPAQQQLCDQHAALGTVAGALDSPIAELPGDSPAGFSVGYQALPEFATPAFAPSSRGPPTLS